ncbi:MAG: YmdB family metallophosphoesterase [Spirochaetia bacterium]|nr:YmdB family metallophosphoesterase [Spirochaetia bacterium]
MAATYRALMLGDVIGTPGLERLSADLPALRKDTGADIVVANGENASGGFGLCDESAKALLGMGVDVISGGNHIWDKKGADELLDSGLPILRPVNYPAGAPGRGWIRLERGGASWLVINAQGRESMRPIDCPFRAVDAALAEVGPHSPPAMVLLDFHAESFQEKQAMAWYLDGRVGAVAGTHTHVQTMDERVLPKGTGYIGDLGMCGPPDSVIGVTPESCLRRNLTQMPIRMEPAQGRAMINGALFTFDDAGHCLEIRRIRVL